MSTPPAWMSPDAVRHTNPDGSTGGWVDPTAEVDSASTVGPEATVSDYAKVTGGAKLFNISRVSGYVRLDGPVELHGCAEAYGHERASGAGVVLGDALEFRSAVHAHAVAVEANRIAG